HTMRVGLAAIKNVGAAAMESILRTRAAEGEFKALEDFCVRVDLRLVNRRVIESLIKAGAFDGLGLPRAHLLAQCDMALESGQRQQREKAEGQGSFFDLIPAAGPAPRPSEATAAAVVPEWDDDQRLAYEKEVLGFYVSGHPLARFEGVAESLGVTSSAELANRSHGARVTLFGHVAAIKETATKSGNRMACLSLEDMAGTVDVTVFPEPYKAAAPLLRSHEPVVVRGRVDEIAKLEERLTRLRQRTFASLTAWQRTLLARHPKRPYTRDWCKLLFDDFLELHGDRLYGDDAAIVGGLARFEGRSLVVIGHQKG